jgi:hypothetical protein
MNARSQDFLMPLKYFFEELHNKIDAINFFKYPEYFIHSSFLSDLQKYISYTNEASNMKLSENDELFKKYKILLIEFLSKLLTEINCCPDEIKTILTNSIPKFMQMIAQTPGFHSKYLKKLLDNEDYMDDYKAIGAIYRQLVKKYDQGDYPQIFGTAKKCLHLISKDLKNSINQHIDYLQQKIATNEEKDCQDELIILKQKIEKLVRVKKEIDKPLSKNYPSENISDIMDMIDHINSKDKESKFSTYSIFPLLKKVIHQKSLEYTPKSYPRIFDLLNDYLNKHTFAKHVLAKVWIKNNQEAESQYTRLAVCGLFKDSLHNDVSGRIASECTRFDGGRIAQVNRDTYPNSEKNQKLRLKNS